MIQISRSLARQLRAVFRRLVRKPAVALRPLISFQATHDVLHIRLQNVDLPAEFQLAGSYTPETFALPLDALGDFEGRDGAPITLELTTTGGVQARWDDGIPRLVDYEPIDMAKMPAFPTSAENLVSNEPGFLKALDDAMETAAVEEHRHSINRVLLRGPGEILATDGRQLLLQKGFRFGWTDSVFVPRTLVFGCRELPTNEPVQIGKEGQHVTVQIGSWSFYLPIETDLRFPPVEQVVPKANGINTRLRLSPEDAAFLLKALPRLPGKEDTDSPITVELNGQAFIRARASDQTRTTELVLARSEAAGTAVRFSTSREYVQRALELGFSEFGITNADVPIVCQQGQRTYVWMLLGKDGAIAPSKDALRMESAETAATASVSAPVPQELVSVGPIAAGTTNGNGVVHHKRSSVSPAKNGTSNAALIEEALALKTVMRDTLSRCNQLVRSIRRHRRQSRLVQTTLASLQQLQRVDG